MPEPHIYRVNDCDWYAAYSLEEAIGACCEDTGMSRGEACDEPYQVSEADMDQLVYVDDPGTGESVRRTFREELARMVGVGGLIPGFFATTEY